MIYFNKPPHFGTELTYISEIINSNAKLCGDGSYAKRCEAWLAQPGAVKKALLTPSCTAALEMAAMLIDIQPGDEVIMPSYTFVSTANAFVLRGATIVFVDIRPDTMNIDEQKIEAAITEKQRRSYLFIMQVLPVKWMQLWRWLIVIISMSLKMLPKG